MKPTRIPYLFLLLALLSSCAPTLKKTSSVPAFWRVESGRIPIDSTITPDPGVQRYLAPYREEIHRLMSAVIGQAAEPLFHRRPEGPLNRLVADWMLEAAQPVYPDSLHMAITNIGGLRADIPAGPITVGKMYEVMPFENELVVVSLTGAQLQQLLEEIAEVGGECVAGVRIWIRNRRLVRATVQGKAIQPQRIYRVVTTDYLSAPGRRRLKTLSQGQREFLGIKLRNAFIEAIKRRQKAGQPIRAPGDRRIIVMQ